MASGLFRFGVAPEASEASSHLGVSGCEVRLRLVKRVKQECKGGHVFEIMLAARMCVNNICK